MGQASGSEGGCGRPCLKACHADRAKPDRQRDTVSVAVGRAGEHPNAAGSNIAAEMCAAAASARAGHAPQAAAEPPGPVRDLRLLDAEGAHIAWEAPLNNGGAPIEAYEVVLRPCPAEAATVAAASQQRRGAPQTWCTHDRSMLFAVLPADAGPFRAEVCARTVAGLVGPPAWVEIVVGVKMPVKDALPESPTRSELAVSISANVTLTSAALGDRPSKSIGVGPSDEINYGNSCELFAKTQVQQTESEVKCLEHRATPDGQSPPPEMAALTHDSALVHLRDADQQGPGPVRTHSGDDALPVRATRAFKPVDAHQMKVQVGDLIQVLEQHDSGWSYCKNLSLEPPVNVGWVPSWIEQSSSDASSQPRQNAPGTRTQGSEGATNALAGTRRGPQTVDAQSILKVMRPFKATAPSQLSLVRSDQVQVLELHPSGWTYGRKCGDSNEGWFPNWVVSATH